MTKVSIIIPVLNCEKYLRRCLDSVIKQTHKDLEIILVPGESRDGSSEICNEYVVIDKRIRVIPQKNNGVSSARNAGLSIASGEYIEFVDADDSIDERKTELLLDAIISNQVELAICDFNVAYVGNCGEYRKTKLFIPSGIISKPELIDTIIIFLSDHLNEATYIRLVWDKLYIASIIKGRSIFFEDGIHSNEDLLFNLEYVRYCKKIFYLNQKLYTHYIYDSFVSTSLRFYENIFENYQKIFEIIRLFLTSYGKYSEEVKRKIEHNYISMIIMCIVRLCRADSIYKGNALQNIIYSITSDPCVRKNLHYYQPTGKESRIIPLLIYLHQVRLIVWVGRYKAYKRYGNLMNVRAECNSP